MSCCRARREGEWRRRERRKWSTVVRGEVGVREMEEEKARNKKKKRRWDGGSQRSCFHRCAPIPCTPDFRRPVLYPAEEAVAKVDTFARPASPL